MNGKISRADKATEHTRMMAERYKRAISTSIYYTQWFRDFTSGPHKTSVFATELQVVALDTVTSAYMERGKVFEKTRTALLNFASYTNPGGGFLGGSVAQEECLCHASFLYNVLEAMPYFYNWNRSHMNNGLYTDSALYSPSVLFYANGDTFLCDVITCAAPNKTAALHNPAVTKNTNTNALRSRIAFVLRIACENAVDTLILGAFGCGVFGQDPYEVAVIFKELLLTTFKGCFRRVVFAIPNEQSPNYQAFAEVFKEV